MKRFRTILLTLLFIAAVPAALKAQNHPFGGGERLAYNLHYKWGVINADVAKLSFDLKEEDYNGTPSFHLVTKGATSNFVANLVKVQYNYDSRFATSDLTPLAFTREQTEGSYWARNNYSWSNGGKSLKAHVEKSTRPVRDTVFNCDRVIYDVITMLYAVRSADLDAVKRGKTIHIMCALDCNLNDVFISYVKDENKKVSGIGTVAAEKYMLKVIPRKGAEQLDKESVIAVSSKGDALAPIYLWITPDASRTIVEFSTSIAVGKINGVLTGASGLKCSLTSID